MGFQSIDWGDPERLRKHWTIRLSQPLGMLLFLYISKFMSTSWTYWLYKWLNIVNTELAFPIILGQHVVNITNVKFLLSTLMGARIVNLFIYNFNFNGLVFLFLWRRKRILVLKLMVGFCLFQPVGFVTFNTRAGAEAAKQDLQVGTGSGGEPFTSEGDRWSCRERLGWETFWIDRWLPYKTRQGVQYVGYKPKVI